MRTDVCSDTVHLDVGDRFFRGFVFIGDQFDIQAIFPEKLLDTIFPAIIEGVAMFEALDKVCRPFPMPFQEEMDMVGHQDKGEDCYIRSLRGLDGDIVHGYLEILPFPEPEQILQMFRRQQIKRFHSMRPFFGSTLQI